MDSTLDPPPLAALLPLEPDLTIVLIKGIQLSSPHYVPLSYMHLSSLHYACVSSLSFVPISNSQREALSQLGWRRAVIDKMCTT